jgi:acyl-CoA hydrolase
VQYIITENGIADLYGKTLKQRTAEMIRIAHPNHQESIEKAYYEMLK